MKNWSGYLDWTPSNIFSPESEEEIQSIVKKAISESKKVRIIGAGHSFTPLAWTTDYLINLDKYEGLISVNKEKSQVVTKAGTKLYKLSELLFEQGMAMENMGDIDRQSIAGTISTGTHGTGKNFKSISNQVIALRFINGSGEIIECSETHNKDLFKSAQVSLGTLGVITEITMQCVPAYKLKLENRNEQLSKVIHELDDRNQTNRNFEFYWFPYTDTSWTKSSNITDLQPDKVNIANAFSEHVLENYAFKLMCEIAHKMPSKTEWVSKTSASTVSSFDKVYHSHKIYATKRMVKFNEMEYNIPAEAFNDVWRDITKTINSKKYNIHFPIEVRFVKGDDIHMSPAYQRESAYIACHAYGKKDPKPYFKALEEIFSAYDGRPHWGKMNTLTPERIEKLYPKFQKFLNHRQDQDPDKIFISPYFENLFGL